MCRATDRFQKLATLEFDRKRKSMSVIARGVGAAATNTLLVKGAAECVVERSSHVMLAGGAVKPMSATLRKALHAAVDSMAEGALRCLALAQKVLHHVCLCELSGSNCIFHLCSSFAESLTSCTVHHMFGIWVHASSRLPCTASLVLLCCVIFWNIARTLVCFWPAGRAGGSCEVRRAASQGACTADGAGKLRGHRVGAHIPRSVRAYGPAAAGGGQSLSLPHLVVCAAAVAPDCFHL